MAGSFETGGIPDRRRDYSGHASYVDPCSFGDGVPGPELRETPRVV